MKLSIRALSLQMLSLLLAAPVLAPAQSEVETDRPAEYAPSPGAESPIDSADVDETTLNRFTDAFVEVRAIHEEYSEKVAGSADQSEAKALQSQAHARMLQSVRDNGLEIEQFNQIAMALQSVSSLQARVYERLEEREGG
jgi:hypothetical protein